MSGADLQAWHGRHLKLVKEEARERDGRAQARAGQWTGGKAIDLGRAVEAALGNQVFALLESNEKAALEKARAELFKLAKLLLESRKVAVMEERAQTEKRRVALLEGRTPPQRDKAPANRDAKRDAQPASQDHQSQPTGQKQRHRRPPSMPNGPGPDETMADGMAGDDGEPSEPHAPDLAQDLAAQEPASQEPPAGVLAHPEDDFERDGWERNGEAGEEGAGGPAAREPQESSPPAAAEAAFPEEPEGPEEPENEDPYEALAWEECHPYPVISENQVTRPSPGRAAYLRNLHRESVELRERQAREQRLTVEQILAANPPRRGLERVFAHPFPLRGLVDFSGVNWHGH